MKLEFDATDARQVKAAHAAIVSLMNGGGTAAPAATPTPAPAPTAPAATAQTASSSSATAPAQAPAAAPTASPSDAPVDMAAATAAFQAFVKANGPGKAKAIIEEFGVKSVKDIPAERLGEFVAKLQA